eukprot:353600-Chlamydomonas_euryale.AAC.11
MRALARCNEALLHAVYPLILCCMMWCRACMRSPSLHARAHAFACMQERSIAVCMPACCVSTHAQLNEQQPACRAYAFWLPWAC